MTTLSSCHAEAEPRNLFSAFIASHFLHVTVDHCVPSLLMVFHTQPNRVNSLTQSNGSYSEIFIIFPRSTPASDFQLPDKKTSMNKIPQIT